MVIYDKYYDIYCIHDFKNTPSPIDIANNH